MRVEDAAAVGMAPRRGMAGPQPAPRRRAFAVARSPSRVGATARGQRPWPRSRAASAKRASRRAGAARDRRSDVRRRGSGSGTVAGSRAMPSFGAGDTLGGGAVRAARRRSRRSCSRTARKASLPLRGPCQRSAVRLASGAPRAAPAAQAPARSRTTTDTPGWVASHAADVSAQRSGSRSTTRRRSRSHEIAPWRWPLRPAQPSAPSNLTGKTGVVVPVPTRRSRVVPPIGMPMAAA